MRTITVKLPDGLATRLHAVVRRRATTRSAVVRQALESHLAPIAAGGAGSCLELAEDLAGSLAGPVDLATNRSHLRGFGR